MTAPRVRADYDALRTAAAQFGQEAEVLRRSLAEIRRQVQTLQSGDWVGAGASAFYAEMNDQVLPAVQRLAEALGAASTTTGQISQVMKAAEGEAARYLRANGTGAAAGAGGGLGATLAGVATSAAGTPAGAPAGPASSFQRFGAFGAAQASEAANESDAGDETLAGVANRAIKRVEKMHQTLTSGHELVSALAEDLELSERAKKRLETAGETLKESGERLNQLKRINDHIQHVRSVITQVRKLNAAEQAFIDDPGNFEKGAAWAQETADLFGKAKDVIDFALPNLPGFKTMISGYMDAAHDVVNAVNGSLRRELERIDAAGGLEDSISFSGVTISNPHYVTKRHLDFIKSLNVDDETKRNILIWAERKHSLSEALNMYEGMGVPDDLK